jgi:hypothetical protein
VNKGRLFLGLFFIAALIWGGLHYRYMQIAPYAVMVNGKMIAVLSSEEEAWQALQRLREQYAAHAPGVVVFEEGDATVKPVTRPMPADTLDAAVKKLDKALTVSLQGEGIFVNQVPMVMLASKEEAAKTISLMLVRGLGNRKGIPTFKERVIISPLRQEPDDTHVVPVATPQQAAEMLVRPPKKQVHTVKKGDSFWTIANEHGIALAELRRLNPGVDHRTLDVGDKLNLPDSPSPVTVIIRPPSKP